MRRLSTADAAFILELLNQPSWLEFIGESDVRSWEQACHYVVRRIDVQFARYGYGMWGVELRQEPHLVGVVGLVKRGSLAEPEFGFALLDRYAGHGFAFEAAKAALSLARALGLKRLLAITRPNNHRATGLLLRLGFELDVSQPTAGEGALVLRYSKDLTD